MKRRTFLNQSGVTLGGSWITMSMPALLAAGVTACKAKEEGGAFKVLEAAEATEFEAIAAQIIPSDQTPGATEAGVIYFMDTVLADMQSAALEPLRNGLAGLHSDIWASHHAKTFADLSDDQQIEVLKGIENTKFFGTLRFLTVAGMFSNPSYGGNRDEIGWKLIGFEAPHAWQPPFGYYDAEYAEKGA
jgi:gluconate 2-dehydrogenase gamma chain